MAFLDCSLALGMVAAEARGSIAARQAAGALPWMGMNDSAKEHRQQADHTRPPRPQQSNLVLVTRGMRCRKTEACRTIGSWMTVARRVTQSLCYLFIRTSTLPMPESKLSGGH